MPKQTVDLLRRHRAAGLRTVADTGHLLVRGRARSRALDEDDPLGLFAVRGSLDAFFQEALELEGSDDVGMSVLVLGIA